MKQVSEQMFLLQALYKMEYDGKGVLPLLPDSKALISFELAA